MAVQEINAAGGVNGQPVVRYLADEGTDPETAAKGLDELLTKDQRRRHHRPGRRSRVALGARSDDGGPGDRLLADDHRHRAVELPRRRLLLPHRSPSDTLQAQGAGRGRSPRPGGRSTAIITSDDDYGRELAEQLAADAPGARTPRVDQHRQLRRHRPPTSPQVVERRCATTPASVAVIGVPDPAAGSSPRCEAAGTSPRRADLRHRRHAAAHDLFEQVQPGKPESVAGIQGTSPGGQPASRRGSTTPSVPSPRTPRTCTRPTPTTAPTSSRWRPRSAGSPTIPTQFVAEVDARRAATASSCRNFTDCAAARGRRPQHRPQRRVGPHRAAGERRRQYGSYDVFVFDADGTGRSTEQPGRRVAAAESARADCAAPAPASSAGQQLLERRDHARCRTARTRA